MNHADQRKYLTQRREGAKNIEINQIGTTQTHEEQDTSQEIKTS
jgi:hypothetical protein